jgi:hypothetical protein
MLLAGVVIVKLAGIEIKDLLMFDNEDNDDDFGV